MGGTKKQGERNARPNGKTKRTVSRHLRLAKTDDDWLVKFATSSGFTSEIEAVRHIIRDFRQRQMQPQASP